MLRGAARARPIAPDDQDETDQADQAGDALPAGLAQARHHAAAPGGGEKAQGVHSEEETKAKYEDGHEWGLRWGE